MAKTQTFPIIKLTQIDDTNNPQKVDLRTRTVCDPRDLLAAERTFLAWIRTGLAMMGFGFVVARFGLLLREIAATRVDAPNDSPMLSVWFGTALVILGVIVNLVAVFEHLRWVRYLKNGTAGIIRASYSGILLAITLVVLGVFMIVFLLLLH